MSVTIQARAYGARFKGDFLAEHALIGMNEKIMHFVNKDLGSFKKIDYNECSEALKSWQAMLRELKDKLSKPAVSPKAQEKLNFLNLRLEQHMRVIVNGRHSLTKDELDYYDIIHCMGAFKSAYEIRVKGSENEPDTFENAFIDAQLYAVLNLFFRLEQHIKASCDPHLNEVEMNGVLQEYNV